MSDLEFYNVDFALDSKRVVDCINSHIDDSSEFGCVISSHKQLLVNSFRNCHVKFNKRQK